jgi:hypothetical protein
MMAIDSARPACNLALGHIAFGALRPYAWSLATRQFHHGTDLPVLLYVTCNTLRKTARPSITLRR